mgnify:CR=1 FL=1
MFLAAGQLAPAQRLLSATSTPEFLSLISRGRRYSALSSSCTRCKIACFEVSCTSPARKNSSKIMYTLLKLNTRSSSHTLPKNWSLVAGSPQVNTRGRGGGGGGGGGRALQELDKEMDGLEVHELVVRRILRHGSRLVEGGTKEARAGGRGAPRKV